VKLQRSRRLVTLVAALVLAAVATTIVAAVLPYIAHVLVTIKGAVEGVKTFAKEITISLDAKSGDIVSANYTTTLNVSGVGKLGLILRSFDIRTEGPVSLALFNVFIEENSTVYWCGSVIRHDSKLVVKPGVECSVTPVYVPGTDRVVLRISCREVCSVKHIPARLESGNYTVHGNAVIVTDYTSKPSKIEVKLVIILTKPTLVVTYS
jgi:hypothetical protein